MLFGYAFHDLIVADKWLQFERRNGPGFWFLFSATLEHSHVHTSFSIAVITPFGWAVTIHVRISSLGRSVEGESPFPCPRGTRFLPGTGGIDEVVFTWTYVGDAGSVKRQSPPSGERCSRASQSIGSDNGRLLGARQAGEPLLLSLGKVSSLHTRLEVLRWVIDTVSITISLPQTKLTQLRKLLAK